MTYTQYKTISKRLKQITYFIEDLAGFSFKEGPLDFSPNWTGQEEKECVKKELLNLLSRYKSSHVFLYHPIEAKKLENLFQSIIDCL